MAESRKTWGWKLELVSLSAMGAALASSFDCARAQIRQDSTLGAESSIVTPLVPGSTVDVIEGGSTRGANLFHSFEQFSVPTGGSAYFNNALDIQNIISRVTGSSISNIDGLIRANGTANLFLLNPNGIIFGPNARLNIGGSFLGTTASSLNFADGTQFSATAHPTTPLLTISVPIGLQFGPTAGSIVNQSGVSRGFSSLVGLQVQPGKTLALVGGDVRLNGGHLQAPGGRVELGGVASEGTVKLNIDSDNLSLNFPDGVPRADVSLANAAGVNVGAYGGGSIAINARNLDVLGQSFLAAGIVGSGFVDTQAGDITLSATGAMTIANSGIFNAALGPGKGGDLRIDTRQLLIRDGLVATANYDRGRAGALTVNASDSVEVTVTSVDGVTFINTPFGIVSAYIALSTAPIFPFSGGDAGHLTINTGRLIVQGGARVISSADNENQGGILTLRASDSVELIGTSVNGVPSALVSGTQGAGTSGDMTIETRRLVVRDGAVVTSGTSSEGLGGDLLVRASDSVELIGTSTVALPSSVVARLIGVSLSEVVGDRPLPSGLITGTAGDGKAGDMTIETGRLVIRDGAQASVSTAGAGNAGRLTVRASEVELTGTSKDGYFPSSLQVRVEQGSQGNGGTLTIEAGRLSISNGALVGADTSSKTIGNGGDSTIEAGQLIVRDRAQITVSNQGTGKAGNLKIASRDLLLDNQGKITAETASGQGNIILRSQDLVLRRGSNITTNATGKAEGGNITIDSGVLAALENSDITANAQDARGGRVIINAQGIFRTGGSDITASSNLGPQFSGTIEINTPDVDPSRGLATLPVELADVTGLIAQACPVGGSPGAMSKFIVTGRGGLPDNPSQALSSDAVWVDLDSPSVNSANRSVSALALSGGLSPIAPLPPDPTAVPLVEATGWVTNAKGEVVLTATAPSRTLHIPWLTPVACYKT